MLNLRVIKHYCAAGCGRTGPDPTADITLEDGTIVPVGKGTSTSVANTSLLYNEYPLALTTLRPLRFISYFFTCCCRVVTGGQKRAQDAGKRRRGSTFFISHCSLYTPNVLFYLFPFVYSESHWFSLFLTFIFHIYLACWSPCWWFVLSNRNITP